MSETEKAMELMARKIVEALRQTPESEWNLASQPFQTKEQKELETKQQWVTKPSDSEVNSKELIGFQTYTFLDQMFLGKEDVAIVGMPFGSNNILTGLPNSGKSLLVEEIALKVAWSGKKVLYVTSEEAWKTDSPRYDLENRMMEKAKILTIEWDIIKKNLFILDTVTFPELREWYNLISAYRLLVEREKIDLVLIDSMTLVEDSRGQIKYRILELMRYNQIHGITSIMINQRAIEESDTLAMAGGISLSHIVDTVFVLDYKKISSWDGTLKLDIPSAKQGAIVNFFRILKCRLCRFNAHYFGYEISKEGFVKLIENKPVEEKGEGLH